MFFSRCTRCHAMSTIECGLHIHAPFPCTKGRHIPPINDEIWQMCSRQGFVLKRQRDNYYCKSANKFKSVHLKLFEIRCTKSTPGKLTQYDRIRPSLKKRGLSPFAEDLTWCLTNRFYRSRFPQKGWKRRPLMKQIQGTSWVRARKHSVIQDIQGNFHILWIIPKCSSVYSPWSVQIFVHQQYQLQLHQSHSSQGLRLHNESTNLAQGVQNPVNTGRLFACVFNSIILQLYAISHDHG